ncbi:hypothetical protein [Agrobacterium tumefaciens]|uniref:hypothetical protein n=1 Tax=Agrobacterium tumefaciens TaxID=358 RepID=UPI0021D2AF37|nr:hypothetical protein [Agrobacterium tumefaciens]UXS09216.1 hypothetical protein FY155_06180 [Agrobacterium tumefaciens]UXS16575.1 hypothetical protein FY154_06175 [Agrobacterium tumefaciens]
MTAVLFKGLRCAIAQTETLALPEGTTEAYTSYSQVRMTMKFHPREAGDLNVKLDQTETNHMVLDIFGFNNTFGSSFDMYVGDVDGRRIWLSAISHGIGDASNPPRLITLTFLMEEK